MADRKRREPPASQSSGWLEDLEAKVREAAARLGELREENRALRDRLEELESAAASEDSGRAGTAGPPGDWPRERKELRQRVERLTESLEGLLEADAG